MLVEPRRINEMKENFQKLQKLQKLQKIHNQTQDSDAFEVKYEVKCSQIENFQLNVSTGDHSVRLDEPKNVAGDNTAMNPVQMLICAYSACMETNWLFYLSAYKLDVKKVVVEITAKIDRRYSLGVTPAQMKSFSITSKIYTTESRAKILRMSEKVEKTCVVGGTINPKIYREHVIEIIHP